MLVICQANVLAKSLCGIYAQGLDYFTTLLVKEKKQKRTKIRELIREWDAMLRIAFGRKNKTLAAEFQNKKVKEIIERNYKTHCAINNQDIPMEFDITTLIDEALSEVSMSDSRARQMDIGNSR